MRPFARIALPVSAACPAVNAARVRVQLHTGSLPWIFVSEVQVEGVIPAPGAAALLAIAGLAAVRRRR